MDGSIATLAGAVIGGIIGIAGTYLGSVYLVKKQRFFDAGQRLREAFHAELAILCDPSDTSDPTDILKAAFKKHLSAVAEFRYILSCCRLDGFNKAWREYHCYENTCDQFLEQYSKHLGGTDLAKENRKLAVKRIEHVLSFTNP